MKLSKEEIVELFNSINSNTVSFKRLISLIEMYFEDINYTRRNEVIQLLLNNNDLIGLLLPRVIDYYRIKYTICSVMFNNKILLYYVTD